MRQITEKQLEKRELLTMGHIIRIGQKCLRPLHM
jgi:hypothetical protein